MSPLLANSQVLPYVLAAIWLGVAGIGAALLAVFARTRRIARRLREAEPEHAGEIPPPTEPGWLATWLIRAGIRRRSAPLLFLTASLAGLLAGLAAVQLYYFSGAAEQMTAGLASIPGGVGSLFLVGVYLAPWFLFLLSALGPTLYVRGVRRRRVEAVESELPLTLDLLATLGEAGLSFDAALDQILLTRLGEGPLARELRSFRADLLAGRPRVAALRRMAWRVDVSAMSILVSALVQAEQLGAGLADVLRRQAEELRARRRERARAFASSLSVKLIPPLIICFLPGIFVWTLGPIFTQFFRLADTLIQSRLAP